MGTQTHVPFTSCASPPSNTQNQADGQQPVLSAHSAETATQPDDQSPQGLMLNAAGHLTVMAIYGTKTKQN